MRSCPYLSLLRISGEPGRCWVGRASPYGRAAMASLGELDVMHSWPVSVFDSARPARHGTAGSRQGGDCAAAEPADPQPIAAGSMEGTEGEYSHAMRPSSRPTGPDASAR